MKAPDKIYIDDLAVVNDCTTKNSTKPLPNFSEYIRKDALVGKMNELYNEVYGSSLPESQGARRVLKILKQFINNS